MEAGVLEDEVVSMQDVLDEDNELEEEARAVLGDSDDQHCTYLAGYVKRQALYACGTCSPAEAEPAGVCLACTLTCHDGHELYELYTKRNFRCDCGNKRFGSLKCKLNSQKEAENKLNKYNQNFRGVYCTCHRPYPDLEDEIEDEMIQCVICEDWYHSRHLGSLPPSGGDFQEMICDDCMAKCSFLQAYLFLSVPQQQPSSIGKSQQIVSKQETEETKVDVVKPSDSGEGSSQASNENHRVKESEKQNDSKANNSEDGSKNHSGEATENQTKPQVDSNNDPHSDSQTPSSSDQSETVKSADKDKQATKTNSNVVKSEDSSSECKLVQLQANVTTIDNKASFWHTGWRSNLCKCDSCMSLYKSLDVLYLTDEADTMLAYEERGREKRPSTSSYESGMQALQNMGRIPQVEVMHEYNDMKSELTEYLREFVAQGKVVKEEDIRAFFDSLQSRKRQRVGSEHSVQYSCR